MKSTLLKHIRSRREELGFTQADLASLLCLTPDAYRKIENGINPLSISRLLKICEQLDISLKNFFMNTAEAHSNRDLLELENDRLKSEIKILQQEVWFLRETNHKLLGSISFTNPVTATVPEGNNN